MTVSHFFSVFSGYWIGNLMRIPKICLKQSFFHSKWILQTILFLTVFKTVFLAVQILITHFSLTVLHFVVFFQVIE